MSTTIRIRSPNGQERCDTHVSAEQAIAALRSVLDEHKRLGRFIFREGNMHRITDGYGVLLETVELTGSTAAIENAAVLRRRVQIH